MSDSSRPGIQQRPVTRVTGRTRVREPDAVVVERPLQLRLDGRAVAVTLRTPGHDEDLALGLLASEGVISGARAVSGMVATPARCADEPDVLDVALTAGTVVDWRQLERSFAATAACGLCGRVHLDALRLGLTPMTTGGPWTTESLMALTERMRKEQETFAETGGLHAAAWCDERLVPRVLREDVGRHNAVDKVCGWLLARGPGPGAGGLLWVSGRAGAELVLKAARAGIPALAAVGAPSSLAISLAEASGMTLIGFLRPSRLNLYCGEQRVRD